MTKNLHISASLALPLDAFLTGTQAILAKKGSGKSYTASVEAEELLAAHQQVVVVDPTGSWWGLRSSPDGRVAGYSIAVLGGEHADVPLETGAGEVVAEAIAAEHFSAVIDLTLFRKGEGNRFMGAFLETLYRKNRSALHLFIDEADVYAPQRPFGDEARTLGACEDIVRRGRIRGIGCTLITQRPQVLSKNVLSQVDMLTALRMNHPKDIGAIREWVDVHGDDKDAKKMIEDLPSLPIGDAWVWAPATDLFKRVTIRRRHTFDSGRTPKAGESASAPKVLAPVDIARLGKTIASTVEQAKANDPKALKAEVERLKKANAVLEGAAERAIKVQLSTKGKGKPVPPAVEHIVEKPVLNKAAVTALERSLARGDKVHTTAATLADRAGEMMKKAPELMAATSMRIEAELGKLRETIATAISPPKPSVRLATPRELVRSKFAVDGRVEKHVGGHVIRARPSAPAPGSPLPPGERATLAALIQYTAGLDRSQLRVLTAYKRSSSDAYIARLRDKGLVEVAGDTVRATREGVQALPDAEPLPTGPELQAFWFRHLPAGEGAVLKVLVDAHPDAVERTATRRADRVQAQHAGRLPVAPRSARARGGCRPRRGPRERHAVRGRAVMRALTLTQPWCSLMAAGIKLVENRSRPVMKSEHIGRDVALHASRAFDDGVAMALQQEYLIDLATLPHVNRTSAVLCVATLAAIVLSRKALNNHYESIGREDLAVSQRQWKMDPSIGYVLRDVIALPRPVPCRGWQGFWTLPMPVEVHVRTQLARAA